MGRKNLKLLRFVKHEVLEVRDGHPVIFALIKKKQTFI